MAIKHTGHKHSEDHPGGSPATPGEPTPTGTGEARELKRFKPANEHADQPIADAALREREAQLRAYARLLDSAIRLPGGYRIGIDGIVGLIPGVGDLIGAGLSGYLVVAAARLGLPRSVIARMVANVAVETVVGAVPLVGDAFDLVFKANERNARLLREALEQRDTDRAHRDVGAPPSA